MEYTRRQHHYLTARYFGPHFESDSTPAIELAGVLVIVYLDDKGRLVISADFDESQLAQGEKAITPVVVRMSGEVVWEATVD